ncbi:unnamed protein product [Caenorhabditis auriculariae]|uniref:RNA polymerase II assembly factor Rtp1 C-terminal domain-containing protein n=1 Tax=Caenorhabditis auriculariae TaxID=2777116 RepID=A0A8S1GZ05_9PELO|nr:unnamed protein product [Caenorhabditis auriculariae]
MNQQLETCLQLLRSSTTFSDQKAVWRDDPFKFLFDTLNEQIRRKGVEFADAKDRSLEESVPSTSYEQPKEKDVDYRNLYSRLLASIFEKLRDCLVFIRDEENSDEYTILSLQNLSVVSSSFQFFVLSGVLPYLDDGVGMSVSARSAFIKTWKTADGDIQAKRDGLLDSCSIIFGLLESNELLRTELVKRYVNDILCANFELLHLGVKKLSSEFKDFLSKVPRPLLVSSLTGLSKIRKGQHPPPQWLQHFVGTEMSAILVATNGLFHLLSAYSEMGGDSWWENVPLRRNVALQLATVPKTFNSSLSYHSNIFRQFIQLYNNEKDEASRKRLSLLMCSFIEELRRKNSKNADLIVFDYILRPWEVLNEKLAHWKTKNGFTLDLDSSFLDSLKVMEALKDSALLIGPRFLQVSHIFVELACHDVSIEQVKTVRSLLKSLLSPIENLGEFLYSFVTRSKLSVRVSENSNKTNSLVQEIGEEIDEKETGLQFVIEKEEPEAAMMRRLEHVCAIIKEHLEKKVLLEMLLMGVKSWMSVERKDFDDSPRFVHFEESGDNENPLFSHFIVGYCFEQVSSHEIGAENRDELLLLMKIVEAVLEATGQKLRDFSVKKSTFDVISAVGEEQNVEVMIETSKACVGIAGAVLLAATFDQELAPLVDQVIVAVEKFVVEAENHRNSFENKLNAVIDDAKMLISLLGRTQASGEKTVAKYTTSQPSTSKDAVEEVLEDLSSGEPAMLGGALLRASRVFRSNCKPAILRLNRADFYESVKNLLTHEDSYVFLAAINCLCEMICNDRSLLKDVLDVYGAMGQSDSKDETDLIRRGRMGEALGKVFREIGDFSHVWLEQIAGIFVRNVRENEEIIRASSCNALADVVAASRGRGLEKFIDEMMLCVDQLLLIDKSDLVRRSSVHFVRQCIASCSVDVIQIMGPRLRDLRRKLTSLWKFDRDDVVRLHAQLCIEELGHCLELIFEEEQSHYCRRIRI